MYPLTWLKGVIRFPSAAAAAAALYMFPRPLFSLTNFPLPVFLRPFVSPRLSLPSSDSPHVSPHLFPEPVSLTNAAFSFFSVFVPLYLCFSSPLSPPVILPPPCFPSHLILFTCLTHLCFFFLFFLYFFLLTYVSPRPSPLP